MLWTFFSAVICAAVYVLFSKQLNISLELLARYLIFKMFSDRSGRIRPGHQVRDFLVESSHESQKPATHGPTLMADTERQSRPTMSAVSVVRH